MTQARKQARIIWDDSNVRNIYTNMSHVVGTREEIMLLFGETRTVHADRKEVRVLLKERILLSPFLAKRLAILLNKQIQEHESRYGPLKEEFPMASGLDRITALKKKPPFLKKEKKTEKASLLFQLMKDLNVKLGFERSFKAFEKTLLKNRFLLGTSKNVIWPKSCERILNICERMHMPENLLKTFKENLSDANYIHFGFEENEKNCIYKAYLEFWDKFEKEAGSRQNKPAPFILHMGFKWDIIDNTTGFLTKYIWYPYLSYENILRRVSDIFENKKYGKSLEIVKGILDIASSRISNYDILYLEVTEDDNQRKSFDINMYSANLQLMELYPLLSKMCEHYSIHPEEFHILYDKIRSKIFGHVSGGIDRDGKDFLTVYYGVEGYSISENLFIS